MAPDDRRPPGRINHVAVWFRCANATRAFGLPSPHHPPRTTNGRCTEHVNNNQVDLSFSFLFAAEGEGVVVS